MKINERLYPHPVLSHFSDDIINSLFQLTPKIAAGRHSYKLEVTARTNNKELQDLLRSSKAQYALHIECSATRFRSLIKSNEGHFSAEIPAEQLDGNVDLCSLIIATEDIQSYTNEKFHPDYQGISFTINKGDVLAVGQDKTFDALKDIDPLKYMSSIFKVRPNHQNATEPFQVTYDEYILISLSEVNFKNYAQLRSDADKQPVLAAMIIIPALTYVLGEIKTASQINNIDEFQEKRFFRVIQKKLRELGCDPDAPNFWEDNSALLLSQQLTGDPLTKSLQLMMDTEEDGE